MIRGLVRLRRLPKVILYVSEETLPITASTENSGKEPKRIHGFTKSRILRKTNLKSNLDIYKYLYLGEILAICDNAMSSIFTYLQHKVSTIESTQGKRGQ